MTPPLLPEQQKTLTVFCPLGLSNRLRVLLSGLCLAEASGRQFKMLWPLTPACAAPFADLFANRWPVVTVDAAEAVGLPYISGWFGALPDLLLADEQDVVVGYPSWLVQPEKFPQHAALDARCQALFAELTPAPPILRSVAAFRREYFRPTMIGVHLRRGDLLRQRPDATGNTAQAFELVDRYLEKYADAGILLCTDDGAVDPNTGRQLPKEGVRQKFSQRYGGRVVGASPRSLDRRTAEAVQDALVDLWLLRSTDAFVGTETSSFSEMAVYGREVPYEMCAGGSLAYQRWERVAKAVGLFQVVKEFGRRQVGRDLAFAVLWPYYWRRPFRRALGWVRKLRSRSGR